MIENKENIHKVSRHYVVSNASLSQTVCDLVDVFSGMTAFEMIYRNGGSSIVCWQLLTDFRLCVFSYDIVGRFCVQMIESKGSTDKVFRQCVVSYDFASYLFV
jgi:hypothetical protein